ncbi:unnamed protein product, partial [Notodromas monacha]
MIPWRSLEVPNSSLDTPPVASMHDYLSFSRPEDDSGYTSNARLSTASASSQASTPSILRRGAAAWRRPGARQRTDSTATDQSGCEDDLGASGPSGSSLLSGAKPTGLNVTPKSRVDDENCAPPLRLIDPEGLRSPGGTPRTPTPFKKALAELEKKGGRVTFTGGSPSNLVDDIHEIIRKESERERTGCSVSSSRGGSYSPTVLYHVYQSGSVNIIAKKCDLKRKTQSRSFDLGRDGEFTPTALLLKDNVGFLLDSSGPSPMTGLPSSARRFDQMLQRQAVSYGHQR